MSRIRARAGQGRGLEAASLPGVHPLDVDAGVVDPGSGFQGSLLVDFAASVG